MGAELVSTATAGPDAGLTGAELAARHGLRVAGARPNLVSYTRQLWSYRNFIATYASSIISASFSQSKLGRLWQVLTPLSNAAVYYLIFGIIINTGRGALVEKDALIDALKQGRLAAAGLDVFHEEPLKPDDPILALPNVVLSPHNAGQTPEVIRDGLLRAVANLENFLNGHPTDVVVAPLR